MQDGGFAEGTGTEPSSGQMQGGEPDAHIGEGEGDGPGAGEGEIEQEGGQGAVLRPIGPKEFKSADDVEDSERERGKDGGQEKKSSGKDDRREGSSWRQHEKTDGQTRILAKGMFDAIGRLFDRSKNNSILFFILLCGIGMIANFLSHKLLRYIRLWFLFRSNPSRAIVLLYLNTRKLFQQSGVRLYGAMSCGEFVRAVRQMHSWSAQPMLRFTDIFGRARYGQEQVSRDLARRSWQLYRIICRNLLGNVPWLIRPLVYMVMY
jgi:hypothetical protein